MRKNSGNGSFVAPRNGHVAAMFRRGGAGAHGKTVKAQRQQDRIALSCGRLADLDETGLTDDEEISAFAR